MKTYILFLLTLTAGTLFSQTINYRSTVVDNQGQPLIGASVQIVDQSIYAITDDVGQFTLTTDLQDFQIIVSYVGYNKVLLTIENGLFPDRLMMETAYGQIDEIVVTAIGIKRERQALSSSVEKLGAEAFTQVPMTNMVNSLAGQVAGLQVTNGSSGVGSSSRIIIRGENSLSGDNQALFVVDGIPISNQLITSDLSNDGALQEVDFGNGAAEISPEDIESISVLKGAGSAALYGSRAANGVVVINTKRGGEKKGMGITLSSSLTFETLLTLPDYQNEYGGGSGGQYAFVNGSGAGISDGGLSSFGPKLDAGLMIPQFDSPSTDINGQVVRAGDILSRQLADGSYTPVTPTPWISRPDNIRDFFETGVTNQNHISFQSQGDNGSIRAAYHNLRNNGILPNTDLKRDGISIGIHQQLHLKLQFDSYVSFVNSRSNNRPNLGYGYENVIYGFNWTGRQTNIASMANYWQAGYEGLEHYDINYLWLTNPYLTLFENTNSFNKNRVLGNGSLNYDITEHLSLRTRYGLDIYHDNRYFQRAVSTNRNPFGSYREDQIQYRETNADLLLTYANNIADKINYSISAGGNRFDQKIDYQFAEASQLSIPGIYSLANSRNPLVGNSQYFTKRINSLYGLINLSYLSSLYLDMSLRNDWSSTLPIDDNSFAYYSMGLSFIVSNTFELPEDISFLKLRVNMSSAGNDTDPYQLNNTFLFNQNYGSNFRVTNETILKNAELKPERLNALEAGMELWMFGNRIQTEISIYENTSINQIIGRPISQSTGFGNIIENGGIVVTKGLEARIGGGLIRNNDIQWNAYINFSTYESVVSELPNGVDQFVTGSAKIFGGDGGSNEVFYIAKEGGRVGDMYGTGFVEVDGRTLYGSNGLPVQDGQLRLLGNYNPDFALGLGNEVIYKNFSFNLLFDWRQGGTIVSRTKALGSTAGVLAETLVGRENGIIGDGVVNIGSDENPQYVENTTVVPASTYYNNYYDRGNEASALYDASYIKLRQIGIYYSFSEEICAAIGFQSLKLGFLGSNLWLWTENPHFDPELNAVQERNFTYGVEDMSYPSTRSFGISLKSEF
ncbi:SusC/RagA family TonB-linked outer membrane protein [Membranihabitans marinus]|uniref:SusC/RagA family TonB-linked outer membrane protein n=1 Tax=Membranihabitans marinus TaxID=1227546 RepID=UPI001F019A70|nr:SusC/RagA family TonB-linked outer membrane protein [Membranihabitans marinus]